MSQTDLESQKLLIKAGLVYQIQQARRTAETTRNDLDKKMANIVVQELGKILNQVDDLKSVTKARQWFRDISEGPIESGDIGYKIYLQERTGMKVDLFGSLIKKVTKFLKAGKIRTEGQYRTVELALHLYVHQKKGDDEINALDKLLSTFQGKVKK